MQQRCQEVEATRQPLVRRPSAASAPRMYNPRFEEDYAAGKDYDPDRSAPATLYRTLLGLLGCRKATGDDRTLPSFGNGTQFLLLSLVSAK